MFKVSPDPAHSTDQSSLVISKEGSIFVAENLLGGSLEVTNPGVLPSPEIICEMRDKARRFIAGLSKVGASHQVEDPGRGLEHEYHIYDAATGQLARGASEIIMKEANLPSLHKEVGAGYQIEIVSGVHSAGPESGIQCLADIKYSESVMATIAAKHGWIVVPTSVAASQQDGVAAELAMDPLTHNEVLLWQRYREETGEDITRIEVKLNNGKTHTIVDDTAAWGLANGAHYHYSAVDHEQAVLMHNVLIVMQPLTYALSASGGMINGVETKDKDVRLKYLYGGLDESGEGKACAIGPEFNLGISTKLAQGVAEIFERQIESDKLFVTLSSHGGEIHDVDAYHSFRECAFPTVLLRPDEHDPRELRVEYRLPPMQLSPDASVGLMRFLDLVMDYYRDNPEAIKLSQRMKHQENDSAFAAQLERRILTDLDEATRCGITARVHDPASLAAETKPACEILAALYENVLAHASAKGSLSESDRELIEQTVHRNILERKTDSDRFREVAAKEGILAALNTFAVR